jgi:peptide/nickel transport system ATP-binding protein
MMDVSATSPAGDHQALLSVKDLSVRFVSRDWTVSAVNGVSFDLAAGEVVCIIGESGSGKSVTMRALMRLLPTDRSRISGNITIDGTDVLSLSERQLSAVRGAKISMIFQEPMTALDPVFTIGDQITETLMRHRRISRADARKRALELLELVRIPSPERRLNNYPHELSGGLRQRAMIAVALSCGPKLLLADEPTTALDATVQIQVLILLKKLQQELGMSIIFVTHDLAVAAQIADRVAVMYAGRIIEYGAARDVLLNPQHPYTLGMLASTVHGQDRTRDIEAIPGSPPDMRDPPPGCSFAPRCKYVHAECSEAMPSAIPVHGGGYARCIRLEAVAESRSYSSTSV